MKVICYLVVQGKKPKYGHDRDNKREAGALRLTKTKPAVQSDEIAIRLEVEIPDSLFFKPTLMVSAALPENSKLENNISADVADNIAEIIREQTGLKVVINSAEDAL